MGARLGHQPSAMGFGAGRFWAAVLYLEQRSSARGHGAGAVSERAVARDEAAGSGRENRRRPDGLAGARESRGESGLRNEHASWRRDVVEVHRRVRDEYLSG